MKPPLIKKKTSHQSILNWRRHDLPSILHEQPWEWTFISNIWRHVEKENTLMIIPFLSGHLHYDVDEGSCLRDLPVQAGGIGRRWHKAKVDDNVAHRTEASLTVRYRNLK